MLKLALTLKLVETQSASRDKLHEHNQRHDLEKVT